MSTMPPARQEGPLALICGAGSLPLAVADFVSARGRKVLLFPLQGIARPEDYTGRPHTWVRIAKFGAFVKLAPGVEGLIHISELSHSRVPSVGSVVSEGQEVEVKVLSVDTASQRIALSMKAVLPAPAAEEPEPEPESPEEASRESAASKRQAPLRGGTDRASGGEQFGLKW